MAGWGGRSSMEDSSWSLPGVCRREMVSARTLSCVVICIAVIRNPWCNARSLSCLCKSMQVELRAVPLLRAASVTVLSVCITTRWLAHRWPQRQAAITTAASSLVLMWCRLSGPQSEAQCVYNQSPRQKAPPAALDALELELELENTLFTYWANISQVIQLCWETL